VSKAGPLSNKSLLHPTRNRCIRNNKTRRLKLFFTAVALQHPSSGATISSWSTAQCFGSRTDCPLNPLPEWEAQLLPGRLPDFVGPNYGGHRFACAISFPASLSLIYKTDRKNTSAYFSVERAREAERNLGHCLFAYSLQRSFQTLVTSL